MRWPGVASAVVVGLTACSSGGEAEDTVPSQTDPPVTTTMLVEATTTTESTTTTSTTVPPTTTTTTTLAPTTTVDPLEQLAAEIERDLNLGEQALLAAFGAPTDAQVRAALSTYFSGPSLNGLLATLDAIASDGLLGRPNPEVPSMIAVVSIIEAADDPEAEFTLVELCRVDAGVIYEPLADGGEIVVNDRIRVVVTESRVKLSSDVWVLDGGDAIEELGSDARCGG